MKNQTLIIFTFAVIIVLVVGIFLANYVVKSTPTIQSFVSSGSTTLSSSNPNASVGVCIDETLTVKDLNDSMAQTLYFNSGDVGTKELNVNSQYSTTLNQLGTYVFQFKNTTFNVTYSLTVTTYRPSVVINGSISYSGNPNNGYSTTVSYTTTASSVSLSVSGGVPGVNYSGQGTVNLSPGQTVTTNVSGSCLNAKVVLSRKNTPSIQISFS